jgi:hypothetical protein
VGRNKAHFNVNKVSQEGFTYLEKADIQEILNSQAAKLNEEDSKQLIALSQLDDEENSDTFVVRPQLTISTLKRGLWMEDDLVTNFFGVNHFMNRSLKFKNELQAGMAQYKDVYKDMQQVKQSQITSFFSFLSTPLPYTVLFNHPDWFQPQLVSDWLQAGQSGDQIQVGAKFYAYIQSSPGAHPASCTMDIRSSAWR